MRIRAYQLVKGATNLSVSDVVGVRYAPDFASAPDIVAGGTGATSSILALFGLITTSFQFKNRHMCLVGNGAATTAMLLIHEEDFEVGNTLFIRRNSVVMEANRLVVTDLGYIYDAPGKLRGAQEMNQLATNAFMSGFEGAMKLSNSLYLE